MWDLCSVEGAVDGLIDLRPPLTVFDTVDRREDPRAWTLGTVLDAGLELLKPSIAREILASREWPSDIQISLNGSK
jgi:hypothetical protein